MRRPSIDVAEHYIPDLFICRDYTLQVVSLELHDGTILEVPMKASAGSTTDYDLTGQTVWPAARMLSSFILSHGEFFQNRAVLELGCGTGLVGLVSSLFASKVLITDGNEEIVQLAEENVNLWMDTFDNVDSSDEFAKLKSYNKKIKVKSCVLRWGETAIDPKIHIVVGADVLFWPASIEPLIRTLAEFFYGPEAMGDTQLIVSEENTLRSIQDVLLEDWLLKKEEKWALIGYFERSRWTTSTFLKMAEGYGLRVRAYQGQPPFDAAFKKAFYFLHILGS